MKKAFLIILGFFSFLIANAQPDPVRDFNKHVLEQWTEQYVQVSQYRVKGSPYLLGESFEGQISFKTLEQAPVKNVLYNIYDQTVGYDVNKEFIKPDDQVIAFYIQLPSKFGGEKLHFIPTGSLKGVDLKGYFNVISDGPKIAFLQQFKTRLVNDPANMYTKDIKMFEQYSEYYIFNRVSSDLNKVKLREKDVLSAFGGLKPSSSIELNSVAGIRAAVEEINKQ
jgi:hypothetical protein